ncbi:MAG: DUF58 domain-containing protein [Deferribacterales bacterium]
MIKITKAGWLFIIITILLGFAAINTNNNLVFIVVSFMLGVMGVSGFLGKGNLDKLKFKISQQGDLFAGEKGFIHLLIENKKRFFPTVLLNINILNRDRFLLYIERNGFREILMEITPTVRGYIRIDEITVSSPFPFKFFIRWKKYKVDLKFIVYPKPLWISDGIDGVSQRDETDRNRDITLKMEELSNIRGYANDPARRIFWKQFAKSGNLYTKEYTGDESEIYVISFEDILMKYQVEDALSISTAIVLDAYNNRGDIAFQIKDKLYFPLFSEGVKKEILTYMALYGKSED